MVSSGVQVVPLCLLRYLQPIYTESLVLLSLTSAELLLIYTHASETRTMPLPSLSTPVPITVDCGPLPYRMDLALSHTGVNPE